MSVFNKLMFVYITVLRSRAQDFFPFQLHLLIV